ncbi:hypothetical protein CY34DRAFT_587259 [Suillus luteus UH-Slu-Lm8-n1]|uniref:Unplaced genomic scaffold CY34scaffold_502, whole genome shotgun sequence n=1 Tax=Suillus luteus UH-Slu-Lm8-n1 TaxID=930992 RepID=A0A0D0AB70_9AGAM|nr:hypothetical protein CY34DRAFT_587259 [Suillus luteus UH-Slu-Lm8-n1]
MCLPLADRCCDVLFDFVYGECTWDVCFSWEGDGRGRTDIRTLNLSNFELPIGTVATTLLTIPIA